MNGEGGSTEANNGGGNTGGNGGGGNDGTRVNDVKEYPKNSDLLSTDRLTEDQVNEILKRINERPVEPQNEQEIENDRREMEKIRKKIADSQSGRPGKGYYDGINEAIAPAEFDVFDWKLIFRKVVKDLPSHKEEVQNLKRPLRDTDTERNDKHFFKDVTRDNMASKRIIAVLDNSGSIGSDELNMMVGEIHSIAENKRIEAKFIDIWAFSDFGGMIRITKQGQKLKDITKVAFNRGITGGTNYNGIFRTLQDEYVDKGCKISGLFIFTDTDLFFCLNELKNFVNDSPGIDVSKYSSRTHWLVFGADSTYAKREGDIPFGILHFAEFDNPEAGQDA